MVRSGFTLLFTFCISLTAFTQVSEFRNGRWLINKKFVSTTLYSVDGVFTKQRPAKIDSVIDLGGKHCIPPFGDAHTHNLEGGWNLVEMVKSYINEGVFYVQVLGNNGEGSKIARPSLEKSKQLDVSYANGLLTSTYGHGFFPYEPLAMGIYAPYLQYKYADSIKKSRIVENKAYYFLDSKEDVDNKWPLVLRYHPDIIKICLNDSKNYITKRKAERADDNGLPEEVARYVVLKAHAEGLRVFAHVETADDARICAAIGVDGLAHMPGYYWDGRDETKTKYCITTNDIALFKKAGMAIIPTFNVDGSTKFDSIGNPIRHPDNFKRVVDYKTQMLRAMYKAQVPIALGADYFGKTVLPEIDSLLSNRVFTNVELIDIYSRITPTVIFPKRKIGEIREGYEASFLVLDSNPYENIKVIKTIVRRYKQGKFVGRK